jgi:hypothetical protein
MHEPGSRIVCWESQDDPTSGWEEGNVSSWWIFEVEGSEVVDRIKDTEALSENPKVVAVKMDWMGNLDGRVGWLLDDPVSPGAFVGDFDHVVWLGVVGILLHNVSV